MWRPVLGSIRWGDTSIGTPTSYKQYATLTMSSSTSAYGGSSPRSTLSSSKYRRHPSSTTVCSSSLRRVSAARNDRMLLGRRSGDSTINTSPEHTPSLLCIGTRSLVVRCPTSPHSSSATETREVKSPYLARARSSSALSLAYGGRLAAAASTLDALLLLLPPSASSASNNGTHSSNSIGRALGMSLAGRERGLRSLAVVWWWAVLANSGGGTWAWPWWWVSVLSSRLAGRWRRLMALTRKSFLSAMMQNLSSSWYRCHGRVPSMSSASRNSSDQRSSMRVSASSWCAAIEQYLGAPWKGGGRFSRRRLTHLSVSV
mmetsp:Transcript_29054/g.83970  ORF Transcript_29054/g.83970 Transcript_29054/m.83970 type:complete len:316 (+) Transcript_29054:235-1182(+)